MQKYVSDRFFLSSAEPFPMSVRDGALAFQYDTKTEWYKISGVWTQVSAGSGSGSSSITITTGSSGLMQFCVNEIGSDWLKCQIWNGSGQVGDAIYVAKSYELRRTPWDGQTINVPVEGWNGSAMETGFFPFTYTYYSNTYRSVNNGSDNEYETVMPAWQTGRTIIYATYSTQDLNVYGPDSGLLMLVDINNAARIWGSTTNFTGTPSTGTPEPEELTIFTDMPLDQAIYVPELDKIFGVRDQWLYKFNASGQYESSLRFAKVIEQSHIAALGTTGYIASWHGVIEDFNDQHVLPDRDVTVVDLTSMSVTRKMGLQSYIGLEYRTMPNAEFCGFKNIVTNGTGDLFVYEENDGWYRVNPVTSFTGYLDNYDDNTIHDGSVDKEGGVIWWTSNFTPDIYATDINYPDTFISTNLANNTPSSPKFLGITFVSGHRWAYAVAGNNNLIQISGTGVSGSSSYYPPLKWAQIDLSLQDASLSGICPIKVKHNIYDDKVYIPTWTDDRVIIFDPVTHLITAIKSGFSSPFDMVFTPTKQFAVQQSVSGLKEIV